MSKDAMAVKEVSPSYAPRVEKLSAPEGYRHTEVGVIPTDWRLLSFSKFLTELRGGAPLKPSDFTPTGVKVLPKGGVGRSGWLQVSDEDLQYCSLDYAASHKSNQVNSEYTIIVLRDLVPSGPSIGLMVQIRDSDIYVLAQGVYGFRVNDSAIPGYLVQLSNTSWYRKVMNSIMVGSTQVHVTNSALREVKIPLPEPQEQRAIATALSDVDALLEELDRLIAKKRDLKQAAMQQLLTGQTRLPGFEGAWEVRRLNELAEVIMGQSPSSSSYNLTGVGLPLIQGNADIDCRRTIKRVFTTQITKKGKAGDILMSVRAPVGEIAIATFDVCLGRGVCAIRTPNNFLYHYLIYLEPTWARHSKGSTFDSVNSSDIKTLELYVPSDNDEQKAIAAALSSIDTDLESLEQRHAKTKAIKQAMMQELLTGRTRLV